MKKIVIYEGDDVVATFVQLHTGDWIDEDNKEQGVFLFRDLLGEIEAVLS